MILHPFGETRSKPSIIKSVYEDLGDDPDNHRWRAFWCRSVFHDGIDIELRAYPVIKLNDKSVWIDEYAYRSCGLWFPEKNAPIKKRLLHNGSGSAWAKPTQKEAIESLAIRLCRWTSHLANDLSKAQSAAKSLAELEPSLDLYAQQAIKNLENPRC